MPGKSEKVLKLICKECGYENEAQRVYCHNCGTKLDRSIIPKPEEKKSGKSAQRKTASHVKRASGKTFSLTHEVLSPLFKVVVLSFMTASLLEIVRPPDNIPPQSGPTGQAPLIVFDLDAMLQAPNPLKREYTQAEVNDYLRTTVKAKGKRMAGAMEFGRVFVNFYDDNTCRFGLEQRIFGYPLYAMSLYSPAIENGKLVAVNSGGYIGRLPIHPSLMQYGGFIYNQIWEALAKELDRLGKMQSVQVRKEAVTVISSPSAAVVE